MNSIKVDFLRLENQFVVRVFTSNEFHDFSFPTSQDCYDFVEDLWNGYVNL